MEHRSSKGVKDIKDKYRGHRSSKGVKDIKDKSIGHRAPMV